MERNEMVVLGLFSLGGYVLGLSIDRRIMKRRYAKTERAADNVIRAEKEIRELAHKVATENKILKAKIHEMGCL